MKRLLDLHIFPNRGDAVFIQINQQSPAARHVGPCGRALCFPGVVIRHCEFQLELASQRRRDKHRVQSFS